MSDDALVAGLSDASKNAMFAVFGWGKKKRDRHLRDIDGEIAEYKAASLIDESYNKSDVSDIINSLKTILKVSVESEQRETQQMYCECLRQALVAADKAGATVSLDVSGLDTPSTLGAIGGLESSLMRSGPAPLASRPVGGAAPLGGLAKLEPVGKELAAHSADLASQLSATKEENEALLAKVNKMQQQFNVMMQEKSKVTMELNGLRDSSSASGAATDSKVAKLKEELDEAQAMLARKSTEAETTQKELTGKLNESAQFKTMKKMLMQKTQQAKELRTKLLKYEPAEASGTIELNDDDDD